MNERRSINTRIWLDEWFESLKPEKKLIWLYLLTNPSTNLIGIYEISIRRISFDTGLDDETVKNIIDSFVEDKKIFVCDGHVIILNWIKNQSMNVNMKKCAKKLYNNLSPKIMEFLKRNHFESYEKLSNGSPSISPRAQELEIPFTQSEELKYDKEAHQQLCNYFGITELGNERQWMDSVKFIIGIEKRGKLKTFKEQFKAYKEYRQLTKATWQHAFSKYIIEYWDSENWIKKLEECKNNSNEVDSADKKNSPITHVSKSDYTEAV